jgi:anti-sigma factor RsiW
MSQNHPFEQEELMAYLDGELSTDRAAAAVAHLERCPECQRVAAVLRDVSQELMAWEVGPSSPRIEAGISPALEERGRKEAGSTAVSGKSGRGIFRIRRFAPWALGLGAVGLVVLVGLSVRNRRSNRVFQSVASSVSVGEPVTGKAPQNGRTGDGLELFSKLQAPPAPPLPASSTGPVGGPDVQAERSFSVDGQPALDRGSAVRTEILMVPDSMVPPPNGPMIVRTAGVTLTTRDFDQARAGLDDILQRHRGYVGELNVNTPAGVGRTLTATLRVPANQLDATLAELRKLGRVEAESQSGQEITAQYVDLEARLSNGRNTERRLTDVLQQRTGKLADVLAVETELSRVRGEIESMESQRKTLANQVDFATLNATVNEDYKAQLQVVPPSTSTQFRNAAVDGYRSMVDGIVGVAAFLFSYGPSLLFWALLLFFPVRSLWRKLRRVIAK